MIEADDVAEITAKTEALKQASYKLAEQVYKTEQAQSHAAADADASEPGPDAEPKSAGDDGVDDVDYEVVDDDK